MCPRLTGCCHSWKRWAAPVATSCPTPQLQSASLAWSTRGHRVSLGSYPLPLRLFFLLVFFSEPQIKCNGLGSPGDSLDSLIQCTVTRVCTELDSASSPRRTQAFTLIIWVTSLSFLVQSNITEVWIFLSLVDTTAEVLPDKIYRNLLVCSFSFTIIKERVCVRALQEAPKATTLLMSPGCQGSASKIPPSVLSTDWQGKHTVTFSYRHRFMHPFKPALFVIFFSSSLCSMTTTWACWQQMVSLCWWLILSTSWTAVAMPTCASCTASGFSVRILPSWCRDSMRHLKVVNAVDTDFGHKH